MHHPPHIPRQPFPMHLQMVIPVRKHDLFAALELVGDGRGEDLGLSLCGNVVVLNVSDRKQGDQSLGECGFAYANGRDGDEQDLVVFVGNVWEIFIAFFLLYFNLGLLDIFSRYELPIRS